MQNWQPVLWCVGAYVAGSIPFGLFAGWIAGVDVRTKGSGNIGFTNVLRVCGPKVGLPVLLLDIAKGFFPSWCAMQMGGQSVLVGVICGLLAILGHNFPVWLRFRGGKGVATSAGVLGALLPQELGLALLVFLVAVGISRYISLGSILGALTVVVSHLVLATEPFGMDELPRTILAILMVALVIVRHRSNISRLLAGTENKLFAKKQSADAADDGQGGVDTDSCGNNDNHSEKNPADMAGGETA